MATTVRMFTHIGLVAAGIVPGGSTRPNSDSVFLLRQPYEAGALLTTEPGSPASSDPNLSDTKKVQLVFVQVDPGKRVYYEVTPNDQSVRVASINSPIIAGDVMLAFGPGWVLSVMEVAES